MPNTVTAAAEGLPEISPRTTRRAFLKAAPVAAAVAVVAVPADAGEGKLGTPELDALIARHRETNRAVCEALDRQAEAEESYNRLYGRKSYATHEVVVPLSIGGGVSLYLDTRAVSQAESVAKARERINDSYKTLLHGVGRLNNSEALAALKKAKAADLKAVGHAAREEQKQLEAHDYAKAIRDCDAASAADVAAMTAILAYRCRTDAEYEKRARYIQDDQAGRCIRDVAHDDDMIDALLFGLVPS